MDRCSPQSCVSTRGRYVSKQEDRWDPGLPPVLRSSPPKRCRGGAAPSIAAPCAPPGRTFQYDSGAGRVGDPAVGSLLPAALSARSRQQCNADIPTKWGSAQMNAFDLIQLTPKLNSDAPIPNPPPPHLPDPEFNLGSIRFTTSSTPEAARCAAPPRGETEAGCKYWEWEKFPPDGFRSFASQKEVKQRNFLSNLPKSPQQFLSDKQICALSPRQNNSGVWISACPGMCLLGWAGGRSAAL